MSILNIKDLVVAKSLIKKVQTTIKKYTKPLLIVGPSGVGKTSLILSVANQLKYSVCNVDYDSDFTKNKPNIFVKKQIVLLDNIEEIKGKLLKNVFNHFMNDTRRIIICCSEVTKDFQQIKSKLKLRATNFKFDLTEWVEYLTKKYKIERKNIKKLVKQTQFNKGIAINHLNLEFAYRQTEESDSIVDLKGEKITQKLTMFNLYENVFRKDIDKRGYYFQENTLPMSIFDNYPKLKKNNIEFCTNTSSALSIIDEYETNLKEKQDYSLMPYLDVFVTDLATFDYNQKLEYATFPSYYGKMKRKDNSLTLEAEILKKLKTTKKKDG